MKPTHKMIIEVKNNPNGWVYVIEGKFSPNEDVPPEAIAGAWEVDENGKIIESSFKQNPNYVEK